MAVGKVKTAGGYLTLGGPGVPQPTSAAFLDVVNTWTAAQTFGAISSPGAGATSERFGSSATAVGAGSAVFGNGASSAGANGTAVGYLSSCAGAQTVAVGRSSAAAGTGASALGYAATASGSNSVAVGGSAVAPAASSIAIGSGATVAAAGETGAVVIGASASAGGGVSQSGQQVSIGQLANAAEWRATAVGFKAYASAVSATALGRGARALNSHDVAVGRGSWTNGTDNIIAIGFTGTTAAQLDVYFNSGHTSKYDDPIDSITLDRDAAGMVTAIHGFDGYDATASPTNNIGGGALLLCGGRGTGTAAGGAVKLQAAAAGGVANNTKNTLLTRFQAGPTGIAFFAGSEAAKQTVSGSRGGNAALASLLTALAAYGLLTDGSSA